MEQLRAPLKLLDVPGRYIRHERIGFRDQDQHLGFAGSVNAVHLHSTLPQKQGCKQISAPRIGHVIPHVAMLFRGFAVQITLAVMSPHKVDRARVTQLTDLPNVGKATADDLCLLGFYSPEQLAGECPFDMYERLCQKTGHRHDPCVIDVFMSVTHFMKGEPPRLWWEFTGARKNILTGGSTK